MILSSPISSVASVEERVRAGRWAIAMAGVLAAVLPLRAAAAGLGEITQQSALGQSLRIVVPVTLGPGEDLPSECFKLTGAEREGDGVPQLLFGRVNLERTSAGTRLVITSGRPVNDPIVRVTVQAGCESAVRREYTLFMDPPAIEAPVVAAATAPAPEPLLTPPPPPSSREPRRAARSQARTTPRAASPSTTAPTSGGDAAAPRKAAPPKGRAVAKAAPVRPPAAASDRPRFSVSSGAPGTLSGKAATEADRERARQERANAIESETQVLRQRIVELTAMVERMQQELRAQERAEQAAAEAPKAAEAPATAATPVAMVAPAPSEAAKAVPAPASKAPPTAVATDWWDDNAALIALIVGLGLLSAAALLWKRRRDAAQDDRWRTVAPASIRTAPRQDSPTSVLRNPSAGITLTGLDITASAAAKAIDIVPAFGAADALAVSELSHVTDEARVFVALGHNDRAIAVLRDHIRHSPRAMPAAWLMLLGLYHSTSNRPEFRKLAAEFHEHFNVETPLWEGFGGEERMTGGIENFPHVEQQIVELWRKPGCRAYLDRLLHDNREGRRNGFPLSIYSDILTLLQVLDAPAEIDIDGDLAADGKLDAKSSAAAARPAPTRAAPAPPPARARKPMPPDNAAAKPMQQPIRFEIEPPESGDKKRS